jgi:hypothetical protein
MRPRYILEVLLTVLPLAISCSPNLATTEKPASTKMSIASRDTKVSRIANELAKLPAWSQLDIDDKSDVETLLKSLVQFEQIDEPILRESISAFLKGLPRSYDTNELSKVYVLNRYYFNVPSEAPATDAKFFGGWAGVPINEEHVNLCWPLEFDSESKPRVIGYFRGYFGDVYAAIEEFDYLSNKYGRREFLPNVAQATPAEPESTP